MDQMKPTGTLKPRNSASELGSRGACGTTFEWPPSIQQDLWNYLKPEQQEQMKPILRVLKKPAQCELCCSLLDYMESGEVLPPSDLTLAAIFMYLTREGITDELHLDSGKAIIRPLRVTGSQPVHVSDIVKKIFPSFKA